MTKAGQKSREPLAEDRDEHEISAASAALADAERERDDLRAALAALTPAGAGVAVVTWKVLKLRDDVEEAEERCGAALRRIRSAHAARAARLVAAYGPRRADLLRSLLNAAEPAIAAVRALREADEEIARVTGLLPPEFPLPALLGPDPLAALRRMIEPPATGDDAAPPLVRGKVRVRAKATLRDSSRCGHIIRAGEIADLDTAEAADFIDRDLAVRIA